MCVPACAEGALQIVDGKARLVAENLCDSLGACLGHCPRGAIAVQEREAAPFTAPPIASHESAALSSPTPSGEPAPRLALGNWPVQIRLVPPGAPFLRDAHLVVAADCTAFACLEFHRRLLSGRALLVGCPKLTMPTHTSTGWPPS